MNSTEKQYHHPYSFGIVNTTFWTTQKAVEEIKKIDVRLGRELKKTDQTIVNIMTGRINWLKVDPKIIPIVPDDAAGQWNKTEVPFGLTGFLSVKFKRPIKPNTESNVSVNVFKRETNSTADETGYVGHKTWCKITICSDSDDIQVVSKTLFIETKKYTPPTSLQIEEGMDENAKIELKRLQPYSEVNRPYTEMISINKNSIKKIEGGVQFDCRWNDGQGPRGHAHGGVFLTPVTKMLNKTYKNKMVKKLCIERYNKRIPLETNSTIEFLEEGQSNNKIKFNSFKMDLEGRKTIEFYGYAILKNKESAL